MEPIIGKWQIDFFVNHDFQSLQLGWYHFHFAIVKLISLPRQGARLHKSEYKGFIVSFRFWIPFDKS